MTAKLEHGAAEDGVSARETSAPETCRPEPRWSLTALLPFAAMLVAFGGLFAAGVLSVGHLMDLPVPCGQGHGCDSVANHPSSKVLGVPIAFVGVAAYLTFVFLLGSVPDSRRARVAVAVLTGLGTLFSAGLLVYSQTVIRATCWWCVASGVAMTLLLVLAVAMLRARGPLRAVPSGLTFGLGLLTATAVGLQAGQMKREANAPPIAPDRLASVSTEELIDPAKSLGPAGAPITIVAFTDFHCPACRASHAWLSRFQRDNPDRVRLVFRHRPLESIRGHELSAAAAALSELAAERGAFWPFVDTVFALRSLPDRDAYLRLVERLGLDPEEAEARIADPSDPAVLAVHRDLDLADRLDIQATPTFILLVTGQPPISANQQTLIRLLQSMSGSS